VHDAPLPEIAARRRPERREVPPQHLGTRLGRIMGLGLLQRDEAHVARRAPEGGLVVMHEMGARAPSARHARSP
jgi:hypothetical protein